jgi:integrase
VARLDLLVERCDNRRSDSHHRDFVLAASLVPLHTVTLDARSSYLCFRPKSLSHDRSRNSRWRVLQKKLRDQDFRDLLTILWETGCRPIEARTVEAKHIHGNRAVFERINSKGKRIQRTVYFNDKAMRIINRQLKKYPTGPLLRNSKGKPWTKDAIKCRFQRLDLPFEVSAYDFRHGFATRAIESGKVSDLEIALLMGHRDTRMLATVYQHVGQKHLERASRKLA